MKTIGLSLSPKYVSGWGVEEAVREILQNAIDQKADGAEVSVSYDRETPSILTDGARLKTSTLLLGESGKGDERYIGKYGEGCKLALLVLTRERKPAKVVADAEAWTPEFRLSETFGEESLQIDVEETGVPGGEFAEFRIGGISPAMMRSFGDRFISPRTLHGPRHRREARERVRDDHVGEPLQGQVLRRRPVRAGGHRLRVRLRLPAGAREPRPETARRSTATS